MPGLVRVSYRNASGVAIPAFGVIQLDGDPEVTVTGDYVLNAVLAGNGDGPYMIDDGKGTASSGPQSYGSCVRAYEGFAWAAFDPAGVPPAAWKAIGPPRGKPYMNKSGTGYFYGGIYDSMNNRAMVIKGDFTLKPYIVTEVVSSGRSAEIRAVGLGENIAIDSDFGLGQTGFAAKAYVAPASGSLGSSSLDDVPISYIDARSINGVIFTGQLVLVADGGQHSSALSSVVGDVVGGPTATQFTGTISTAVAGSLTNMVYVDIAYSPRLFSPSSVTRPSSCRVAAFNDTGVQLVNGQPVIVDHIGFDAVGRSFNRWRVSDQICQAVAQ